MEWLETLLPLLIFAVYVLSQLRRSGKKKRQRPQPLPDTAAPEAERAPTPFEELIRQIQRAAEEAQTGAHTPPEPEPEPAPVPKAPPQFFPPPAGSEFGSGGFEHEEHGFGLDNPFSEEAFERLPPGADVTEHAPGHLDYDPHRARRRKPPAPKRTGTRDALLDRLRNPGDARDAIILREILDRPRGRRRF